MCWLEWWRVVLRDQDEEVEAPFLEKDLRRTLHENRHPS